MNAIVTFNKSLAITDDVSLSQFSIVGSNAATFSSVIADPSSNRTRWLATLSVPRGIERIFIQSVLQSESIYYNYTPKGQSLYPTQMKSFYIDTIIRPKSNICFPADEIIQTDRGYKYIQDIQPHHDTIHGKSIRQLTMSYSDEKTLTKIQKHSLSHGIPNKDTLISNHHKVWWKDKMVMAKELVDVVEGIVFVPYEDQLMYNILLYEEGNMMINDMVVETLHPNNNIAKLYDILSSVSDQPRAIELFNERKKVK